MVENTVNGVCDGYLIVKTLDTFLAMEYEQVTADANAGDVLSNVLILNDETTEIDIFIITTLMPEKPFNN